MEARQTVADHVNCIDLFFRPDVLIFLLDYLDWSRFLERDMQTGYYHPLPIEENVSAEEVGRILKKALLIPSIMTQLTDPRLHSDEGLAELHKWFDRFAAPDIQTEEEFETMDEKYMEHFRRFPQINWAPKRQTPPVPLGPMVRRPLRPRPASPTLRAQNGPGRDLTTAAARGPGPASRRRPASGSRVAGRLPVPAIVDRARAE